MLPVFAVAVVLGALVGVGQHFVCLVYLFELALGVLVAGVEIGVILARELSECALDLVLAGAARDA